MGHMPRIPADVARLQEATRVRIAPERVSSLRSWAEALGDMGSRSDRLDAHALTVLLDMHEALP